MPYCANCGEEISEHQFYNFNRMCPACIRIFKQNELLSTQNQLSPPSTILPSEDFSVDKMALSKKARVYAILGLFLSVVPLLGILFGIRAILYGHQCDSKTAVGLGIFDIIFSIICMFIIIWIIF